MIITCKTKVSAEFTERRLNLVLPLIAAGYLGRMRHKRPDRDIKSHIISITDTIQDNGMGKLQSKVRERKTKKGKIIVTRRCKY